MVVLVLDDVLWVIVSVLLGCAFDCASFAGFYCVCCYNLNMCQCCCIVGLVALLLFWLVLVLVFVSFVFYLFGVLSLYMGFGYGGCVILVCGLFNASLV